MHALGHTAFQQALLSDWRNRRYQQRVDPSHHAESTLDSTIEEEQNHSNSEVAVRTKVQIAPLKAPMSRDSDGEVIVAQEA